MAHRAVFGVTAAGKTVERITLCAGDLTVAVLTWGAVLQSVRLAGVPYDLTLGSETLADYEGDFRYHGSIIAPVVNRLTDAQAPLGDRVLQLEPNFNGRHCLHSGAAGTQLKVWDVVEVSDTTAVLGLDLPDGEGGFPGNRRIEARFEVTAQAGLRLTITAVSDALTLWNATNHSYWNLDGSADFTGHRLRVAAEQHLPATPDFIPTGEIQNVAGTEFDFRTARVLSPKHPDLDKFFCLGRTQQPLRDVLWLQGTSGVQMVVATTEAGVQVYDCRQDGFKGVAIEAQNWTDAPNKPGFPSIDLPAGEARVQVTEWRFVRG
jgi:aldose 1-epimerase